MKKIIVLGISLLFFFGIASQAFSARKIHCWDLNENYDCDIETEDMNVDGKCNVHDCETGPPEEPCYTVQQTGQTTSYATGDDGELQTGMSWPDPRFTDNGNGTVTDNLTGLIWTKNARCPWQNRSWNDALTVANSLHDGWTGDDFGGDCELEDGSSAGDWRLPNVRELLSMIGFGNHYPALPSGHPFVLRSGGSINDTYWSSTSSHLYPTSEAWAVNMGYGDMTVWSKITDSWHVWPVRGPE